MNDEDITIEGAEETAEDTSTEETQETDTENVDVEETVEDTEETTEKETTDKGTKLDPDPLSRANQLRANAEARLREYEKFMNDPDQIKGYLKTFDKDESEEISLDKVETTGDLQKYLKQEREKDKAEIESVKDQLSKSAALNQYDSQLTTVRKNYPDMTDEQENIIGDIFEAANFIKNGNDIKYEPRISLTDVANKVMGLSKSARKEGSKDAQTIVRNASAGRNKSGSVSTPKTDESKMTAEQTIAHRMAQASKKRG